MFKYTIAIWNEKDKLTFVVVHADSESEALEKIKESFNVTRYFVIETKYFGEDYLLERYGMMRD